MKKFVTLLLVLGLASVASAGTMVVTGLPAQVNTSAGDTVLSFDIVSNGQLDNDSMYVFAETDGIASDGALDITAATNNVNAGQIYDDDPLNHNLLAAYVSVTDVTHPVIWADIAIPKAVPDVIVGDILSDIGLTIPQNALGWLYIKALSENTTAVEGEVAVELIPEPVTIALLGLGGLFLRRRK